MTIDDTGTLHGAHVVENSAFIAVPLAGMMLAEQGADVIRIDPPGGGLDFKRWPVSPSGVSLYWTALNKGKRSLLLDTRSGEGREIAEALATRSGPLNGLVISNLPMRGWRSYDTLRAKRADMIMVQVTGTRDGSTAVDYTINARTGAAFLNVTARDDPPRNNPLPFWDCLAAHGCVQAVLTALIRRMATGRGGLSNLALGDVALATMSHLGFHAEAAVLGETRPPLGNALYGGLGREFRTKDDRWLMIVGLTGRQWMALQEATGLSEAMTSLANELGEDLGEEEGRWRARDRICALLEPWCAARTLAEIAAVFRATEVCWAPFQTVAQSLREDIDCSLDNPVFDMVEQPGVGTLMAAGSPIRTAGESAAPPRPAPIPGEHTELILAEDLGLSDAQIGRLKDQGTVAIP